MATCTTNAPELTTRNTLLCVFSYNRGRELVLCLQSIQDMCPGFDVVIVDDASDLPDTRRIIAAHATMFKKVIFKDGQNKKSARGNLHRNIEEMYHYAIDHGYRYLFLIQDDMQILRPLDERVCAEYSRLFAREPAAIQVDPRFLRHTGNIIVLRDVGGYRFDDSDYRNSYSDVGILCLDRMQEYKFVFLDGEKKMKMAAHQQGLKRLFPFTPIMMHIPYPTIYRKRQKLSRRTLIPLRRGRYSYRYLTEAEMKKMDARPLEVLPYAKSILRTRGMYLSYLYYRFDDEARIFA